MLSTPDLMLDDLRLEVLLKNVANRVLADIFKRRYHRSTGQQWEDGAGRCSQFLRNQNKVMNWQRIQKTRSDKGDLNNMDLAQLGQILLKFPWASVKITPYITEEEKSALKAENLLVKELADVRNSHAHFASNTKDKNLAQIELQGHWETALRVLLILGGPNLEGEIEEIRALKFQNKDTDFTPILTGLKYLPQFMNIFNYSRPLIPRWLSPAAQAPSKKTNRKNRSRPSQNGSSPQPTQNQKKPNNASPSTNSKPPPQNSSTGFQKPALRKLTPLPSEASIPRPNPTKKQNKPAPTQPSPIHPQKQKSKNSSSSSSSKQHPKPSETIQKTNQTNTSPSLNSKAPPKPAQTHAPVANQNKASPSIGSKSPPKLAQAKPPKPKQNNAPASQAVKSLPRPTQNVPKKQNRSSTTAASNSKSSPQKSPQGSNKRKPNKG